MFMFQRCKSISSLCLCIVFFGSMQIACDDTHDKPQPTAIIADQSLDDLPLAGNQSDMLNSDEMSEVTETIGEQMAGEQGAGNETVVEPLAGQDIEAVPEKLCPQSVVLNCESGIQQFDTAQGATGIDEYSCGEGFTFPGKELFFEFLESGPQQVQISARQIDTQYSVSYLLFALEGQENLCEPGQAVCRSQDTLINEPMVVDYEPNTPLWFSLDPRIDANATMRFELEVTCINSHCGDGVIDEQEACDDGNQINGDGCTSACQIEADFLCSGTPSVCVQDSEGDCQETLSVSTGVYMGDTRGCASTYNAISGGCGNQNSVLGADQSYLVEVPANTVIRASLDRVQESGYSAAKLWLALDPSNASNSCVQQSSEELFWLNGSDTEQQIMLIVDGISVDDSGTYRLSIDFLNPPARLGSSCAQAIELGMSGVYMGDTSGAGLPSNVHGGVGGECIRQGGFWGYNSGPDEVYKVSLEPGQSMSAVTSVSGNWDQVLSIHTSCENLELSCLQWDDYGRGSVTNEGDQAQDYYIMVGGFHSYSAGEYQLELSIE